MSRAAPDSFVRELETAVPGLDAGLRRAFAAVDRAEFVPAGSDPYAVSAPVPLQQAGGRMASTISAPDMVALMLGQLRISRGDRLLEIGTASGYSAAVMAAAGAEVTSIEILPELARRARGTLERIGSPARAHVGDGMEGRAEDAPYDRVILTCAAFRLPEWVREQTTPDARVVIPLTASVHGATWCLALRRDGDGFAVEDAIPCGFVPLIGQDESAGSDVEDGPPARIVR